MDLCGRDAGGMRELRVAFVGSAWRSTLGVDRRLYSQNGSCTCLSVPRQTRRTSVRCRLSAPKEAPTEKQVAVENASSPEELTDSQRKLPAREWHFHGHKIVYRVCGEENKDAPVLLCVHGFGAHSLHWRKNLPELGKSYRVCAIDLLGFGFSAKPAVGEIDSEGRPVTFDYPYWSLQLATFIKDVIRSPVFLIANSIGSVAAWQVSVDEPSLVRGTVAFGPSLRLLHIKRRSWLSNITAPLIMRALKGNQRLAKAFFKRLSTTNTIRTVLRQAYHDPATVDDELVELIRRPAFEEGALDVFLEFITYDTGPIPEDLLPIVTQPVTIVWGEKDSFEPLKLGRALGEYDSVKDFITLPGVGHCAQDEAPEQSNQIIRDFVEKYR